MVSPTKGPIAIIGGAGGLPFTVADAAIRQGRGVVLFPLRGSADPERVTGYPHHWVTIGQFGRFCRIARQEGCRDVVLIGSLVRPAFWQIWPDLPTMRLVPRLLGMFRGGDDHLLSGILKVFGEAGFHLLGAHEVAPEILLADGVLGRVAPSERHRRDIARGLALLRATGPFDIGQAAVVADNRILAVEAADGTDEMLAHVAELRRRGRIRTPGGVLIKAPKVDQDRRIDLPTIGSNTIAWVARAGLAGLAATAGGVIVADAELLRQAADRNKLFVVGIREDRDRR